MKRNLLNTACKLEYNKDLITKYCCYKSPLLLYKPFKLWPLSDRTCQLGIFFPTFALLHVPQALLRCLHSLGKSNTIVTKVKFSVVWANEHISQNPQGTSRNINTQETAEALSLTQNCHLRRKTRSVNLNYYSLKIFPRFWLAKSTRIIHHNHLLMTKFGSILRLMNLWRQKYSLLSG